MLLRNIQAVGDIRRLTPLARHEGATEALGLGLAASGRQYTANSLFVYCFPQKWKEVEGPLRTDSSRRSRGSPVTGIQKARPHKKAASVRAPTAFGEAGSGG